MAKTKKEKDMEQKIEKLVEQKVEEYFDKKNFSEKIGSSQTLKIFGELLGYMIAIVFLFLIFPKLSFITSGYSRYLPIAFWATTIGTIFKILKHKSSLNFFARLFELGDNLVNLYSTYMLIVIYPINFSLVGRDQFNNYLLYFLYFIIVVLTISALSNFIRMFSPEKKQK